MKDFSLNPLLRSQIRQHIAASNKSNYGTGGLPRKFSLAKPITLRRADYEAQKAKSAKDSSGGGA